MFIMLLFLFLIPCCCKYQSLSLIIKGTQSKSLFKQENDHHEEPDIVPSGPSLQSIDAFLNECSGHCGNKMADLIKCCEENVKCNTLNLKMIL